ncbi:PIN domain-containing protein [bacterium]|nr:PIN domain-containing protein [bacterium]
MILMDSSGWIELAGRGPRYESFAEMLRGADVVVVPTVVVREVYRAVELSAGRARADQVSRYIASFHVVSLDLDLAISAARCAHDMKLALADSIIYATAQACGARIVTGDADFAALPGVDFIPVEQ